MRLITGFLFIGLCKTSQIPFSGTSPGPLQDAESDEYQFNWPIRRVAVIGAGPSGLAAYHELTEAGLDVRIFERENVPGGTWHYTEEIPLDAPVPNAPIPIGDFVPSLPPEHVTFPYTEEFEGSDLTWRNHRGPKAIWESMTCTTPSPVQEFAQWPWPAGTPWKLSHYHVRNYVRSYASYLNINSNDENPAASYNTRVEHVEKRMNELGEEQGWRLLLRSLERTQTSRYKATWWTEDFDAVVVATGPHQAPSMPTIPGLGGWVRRFPDHVHHSRQYRRPEAYINQTVLIIGASISGVGISADLNRHAKQIYLSSRLDNDNHTHFSQEIFSKLIPKNTTFIGEIKQFLDIPDGSPIQSGLIELKNGTILSGIDSVILATGFRFSFPFLSQYYDGATYEPHAGTVPTVSSFLPLDGTYLRELYLDQFYIRDPSLAFIGVPLGSRTFATLPYTTLALAKVWTNTAKLPNILSMQAWYERTIEERGGLGKYFLFHGPQRTSARLAYLIGWLNQAAAQYGGKQINGLSKYSEEVTFYWEIAYFGFLIQSSEPKRDDGMLAPLGMRPGPRSDMGLGSYDVILYDGYW